MTIVKPHTSRPANSEKYVLCRGFDPSVAEKYVAALRRSIELDDYAHVTEVAELSNEFIEALSMYNVLFTVKQIVNINVTVAQKDSIGDQKDLLAMQKTQVEHALRWCFKYNMPINLDHLHFYNCNNK